jgi:homopolymeric O-antigen transport system ATP-binding protein
LPMWCKDPMRDVAIRAEGLGKLYYLGGKRDRYRTLRDTLTNTFISPFRRAKQVLRAQTAGDTELDSIIWAVQDVSFEVKHGEIVGIIGRNGAGKSTLLKILARITEPTTGFAEICGRMGSLLEVGTGFHPELTGRENIQLNGAILGMKRAEIRQNFDEIVAFAEVEQFIDTPVKHYSSGMYLRLAFAVAAHLEPEILLVDEVLAVGDAAFQKKCLSKMGEVAGKGRTVLFVSHNMLAIQSLCTKTILLANGRIAINGPTEQAVTKYLASMEQLQNQPMAQREDRVGGERFRFASVQFLNPQTMAPCEVLVSGQAVMIRIGFLCESDDIEDVGIDLSFRTLSGVHLFGCSSRAVGRTFSVHSGEGYTECAFSKWPLKAGCYSYNLYAEKGGTVTLDWIVDAATLTVENGNYYGSGRLPAQRQPGVLVDYTWRS